MPLYRTIPRIVEANQFTDLLNPPRGVQWSGIEGFFIQTGYRDLIHVPVRLGDWIIEDSPGSFIRCAPAVFESTFEEMITTV